MPRQNRVTPFGEVIATPERGTLMGNRGVLHDGHGAIKRNWNGTRWIICLLDFKERKQEVMKPDCYTQLFFLDEATALAAGHRPCAECRRERFIAFRTAWQTAHPADGDRAKPSATVIDACLHADRLTSDRSPFSFFAALDDLPDGVFVTVAGDERQAYLVRCDHLLAWSPGGYTERRRRPQGEEVTVLTPGATVRTIRAGYAPAVHPSAVAPPKDVVEMLPLYREPHFTFRFADDRIIPRFHLEGIEAGRRVAVFRLDPVTGERLDLIESTRAGEGGWVDLTEAIIVRAGDGFVAVPQTP